MNETSINNVAREHTNWLSSLESYKQELGKLKQRLTEIGGKIMGHDAALQLEQYENRFRVQQDNIDRLRHNIKENRNGFNRQSDGDGQPQDLSDRYSQLEQEFSAEERAVSELRDDFNRFSSSWNN
jgi:predicted  nucleic acid-binding Zn-ribbon protein